MDSNRRKRRAGPARPHFEELEPRILYSADLAPQPQDLPNDVVTVEEPAPAETPPQPAEQVQLSDADILLLDENGETLPSADSTDTTEDERRELVFISDRINKPDELLAGISSAQADIVVLDSENDVWTQVLDTLSEHENLDAIHFLTHGTDSALQLGEQWISVENLAEFEDEFRVMQLSLAEGADLLFYGCNLAASDDGQQMLNTIAEWTHADVAASIDLTGHASLGGDWTLEYQLGTVEAMAIAPQAAAQWEGLLSPPTDLATGVTINPGGGRDVYLEAQNGIGSNLTQLTIEASFAITTPNVADNNLLSYRQGFLNHNELYLTIMSSGQINFGADSIGAGEYYSVASYPQLFDGERHHVALSWDNSNGAVTLYIDGILEESTTGYKTGATVNSGGVLVLGQDQDLGGSMDPDQAFRGTYYDTRIWNTVRSATEIADNYQHSFDSGNIPVGLIADWQMKDLVSGTTVVDLINPGSNDLEVKHASDAGFSADTASDTSTIAENSANGSYIGFVIPTDPDPGATPAYSYTLLDSAGGRFAIDVNSGEITVANGALLDYEANTSHNITVEVTDGDANNFSKAITIYVENINEAPGFVGLDNTPTYTEDDPAVVLDNNVQFVDEELSAADNYNGATFSLSRNGGSDAEDVFAASGNLAPLSEGGNLQLSGVTIGSVTSNSAGALLLTFNSNATQARVNEALRSITYANSSDTPPASVQLDWSVDDGNSGLQGDGGPLQGSGSITVNIIAVNDEPVLITNETLDVPDEGTSTITSAYLAATDPDHAPNQIVYTLTQLAVGGSVRLNGTPLGLGETFTQDDIDNNRVAFRNNDHPIPTTFEFTLGDGLSSAGPYSFGLNGVAGNNDPVITSSGGGHTASISSAENHTAVTTITATDAELDALTFSVTGGADAARFNVDSSTGELSFLTAPDFEAPGDANADNIYEVIVEVDDGHGGTDAQTITVTVTNAGGEPAQSLPGAQNTDEDSDLVFSSSNGNAITISDSGSANNLLQLRLTSSNGTLQLSQLTGLSFVEGSDGSAHMVLNGLESAINAALEGMRFSPSNNYSGPADISISTTQAADLEGYYSFDAGNASDDSAGASQDGVLMGGAMTVTDGTRGEVLSLGGNPDYVQIGGEFGQPASITLAAWVNANAGYTEVFSIDNRLILRVDDPNGGRGVAAIYHDGTTFRALGSGEWIAGTGWHHVALTFEDASKTLSVYIDGNLSGQSTFSQSISYLGGDTYLGSNRGLTLFFNGLMDDARVYSRALSSDEIGALANDQTGVTGNISITVNAINDGPTIITNTGTTVAEASSSNIISALMLDGEDSDDADGGLIYTVTAPVSHGTLRANGTAVGLNDTFTQADIDAGLLTYDHDGSQTAADHFDVSLADGGEDGALPATARFHITITNSNDAPVITSDGGGATASINALENQTSVTTLTSTDEDLDAVSYTITGGTDSALFSIDATSGALSFKVAPDFEAPADSNADGTYEVEVTASDGHGGTDQQTLSVTVTDTSDAVPTLSNHATTLAEDAPAGTVLHDFNDAASGADVDTEGTTLTYSLIGGNGAGLFACDTVSGVITLVNPGALDYESTSTYLLTIEADNGVFTDVAQLSIQIENVNEAPVISTPGSLSVNEDTELAITGLSVTDPDAGTSHIEVTISSTHGAMSLGDQSSLASLPVSGSLDHFTLTGSVAAVNQALAGLKFIPDENFNGPASITMSANDLGHSGSGAALSDSQSFSVTVIPINDAPALDVPQQVAIAPGEAIEFSTALENLEPLQDLDSQSTMHHLSLSIEYAELGITDESLLSQVSLNTGSTLEASGDLATINALLNALVITPIEDFGGELILNLHLEDEGGVSVGSSRSLSTQIHLFVPYAVQTAEPEDPEAQMPQNEESQSDHLMLIHFQEFSERDKAVERDDSDDDEFIPALVFESTAASKTKTGTDTAHSVPLGTTQENAPDTSGTSSTWQIQFDLLRQVITNVHVQIDQAAAFSLSATEPGHLFSDTGDVKDIPLTVQIAEFTGAGLVVGSVVWLLKGSSLISSLLVSYPAWRGMDPLPVLLTNSTDEHAPRGLKPEKPKNPRFQLQRHTF